MAEWDVPQPRRGRSLIGLIAAAVEARSQVRRGEPSRLAAALKDHSVTLAAMAAVDVGMFHLGFVAGWVAVGVSLFLADFKVQG